VPVVFFLFPGRWIGRGEARLLGLQHHQTLHLWTIFSGHMKSLVYAKKSNSMAELKAVMSTVEKAQMCVNNHGGHFETAYHT
jgi:hypothetical protein